MMPLRRRLPMPAEHAPATAPRLWPVHAAAGVFGLAYGLSAPLIALTLHARGLSETWIGANAAMYAFGVLLVALNLSGLVARRGGWAILVAGLLGVALVLPMFWVLPWLLAWFVLRLLLGMASESVMVVTESWVSAASNDRGRAINMAVYTASLSAGFALGPAVLGAVGTEGWRPYAIGAVFALLALLLLALGGARPQSFHAEAGGRGILALAMSAPLAMGATALNAALEAAGLSLLPIYAVQNGWSARDATLLISVLMVGAIVLQLPIGWLAERVPRRPLMLVLALLSAVGACLWPAVIGSHLAACVLLFVWGGAFVGIYTLVVTEVGSRYRGAELVALYGAMSVAWGLGALLGPLAAGLALELSPQGLPYFAAISCALFALALLAGMWRRARA